MARILLVEDNEMNRDMLSRRLIRNGYEVFYAKDGQQGVNMALSERPDLILMDMSLPVLDGLGSNTPAQGQRCYSADSGDRTDGARDGRRSREGDRGRLRRLRHQASRNLTLSWEDNGLA